MFDESQSLTPQHARDLIAWTRAWFDRVVAAEFVSPPYYPDATTVELLKGYFHAGLSPAEAAEACFGTKH